MLKQFDPKSPDTKAEVDFGLSRETSENLKWFLRFIISPRRVFRALKYGLRYGWRMPRVQWLVKRGLILALILLVLLAGYFIWSANNRLSAIEQSLGGAERLKCTRQAVIAEIKPSIVRIIGGAGEGSGFFYQKGFIITNYHVIADEPSPKIVYYDNTFENGSVMAVDPQTDLALIRIKRTGLPYLGWYSKDLEIGDEVLATGFPLGGSIDGELTVNVTNIAGRRTLDTKGQPSFLQTNGGIIEGMSGGPVITKCGELVGINVASMGDGKIGIVIASSYARESIGSMMVNPSYNTDSIAKIEFNPDKSAQDAVLAYYNYLKVRNFQEAYDLLSSHFIGSVTLEKWQNGFTFSLDTSVLSIATDRKNPQKVLVHLGSTDLIEGSFVYREFDGSWLVHKEGGHFRLWQSDIKEIKE